MTSATAAAKMHGLRLTDFDFVRTSLKIPSAPLALWKKRRGREESKNALYFEVFSASSAPWRPLRCFQGVKGC